MPSVVSMTNASVKTVQDFFGGVQQYPSESSGSGIIVGQNDSEILVATNNHVADAVKLSRLLLMMMRCMKLRSRERIPTTIWR